MVAPWQPDVTEIRLVDVLHAVADPVRLGIVAMLAETGTENCTGIGGSFDVHKSTLSHHYRVLREAGVTWTVVEGRSRLVSLRWEDLDVRFPGFLAALLRGVEAERGARQALGSPAG